MIEPMAKVAMVTASASRRGGGVFEAVVAQCALTRDIGFTSAVFAIADDDASSDRARFGDVPVSLAPRRGPHALHFAPGLTTAIVAARPAVVHLHGIWGLYARSAAVAARRLGVPLVLSPHGMMAPWQLRQARIKRALATALYERVVWHAAAVIHALTEHEAADVAALIPGSKTEIIPNAVAAGADERFVAPDHEYVYLGRIHAVKNVAALINGWRAAQACATGRARLTIAGWGNAADVVAMERLIGDGRGNVSFVGPVFGPTKAELLARARFLILPSLDEALPVAMLEAWAAGVPTLMSTRCNLNIGFEAGAAIDCGTTVGSVAAALDTALALPDSTWLEMSHAARTLVADRFAPDVVGSAWAALYGRLVAEAPA